MKYIVLIQAENPKLWREVFSGGYGENSYDKCLKYTIEDMGSGHSWMIVGIRRSHDE